MDENASRLFQLCQLPAELLDATSKLKPKEIKINSAQFMKFRLKYIGCDTNQIAFSSSF
jgi:hypothetical protein